MMRPEYALCRETAERVPKLKPESRAEDAVVEAESGDAESGDAGNGDVAIDEGSGDVGEEGLKAVRSRRSDCLGWRGRKPLEVMMMLRRVVMR
jgi:hypothetical protein